MMTLRFAYTRPDGGVSIVTAAPKTDLELLLGALTDAAYVAHVLERSIPADASNVTQLPDDWTPPEDRTFRDAWEQNGVDLKVNMDKAAAIHMDGIRVARNAALAKLDIEVNLALDKGDLTGAAEAGAARQALRDIPQTFDLSKAKTPEALKALWPDQLK